MRTALPVGSCVVVEVPATSANLGPGFDCFGLAFDWRESVQLAVIERGFQVEVTGEGAAELARDESHLIIRSALTGLADLGVEAPGLRLSCRNTIPHGRGLGSSSAATVAGLAAAAGLAGRELDRPPGCCGTRTPSRVIRTTSQRRSTAGSCWHTRVIRVLPWRRRACTPRSRRPCTSRTSPWEQTRRAGCCLTRCRTWMRPRTRVGPLCSYTRWPLIRPSCSRGHRTGCTSSTGPAAMPRSYELVTALRGEGRAAFISGAGPSVAVLGTADLDELDGRSVSGFHLRRVGVGTGSQRASLNALPGRRICGNSLQPGSDPGELPQQIWTGRRLEARRDRGGTGDVLERLSPIRLCA